MLETTKATQQVARALQRAGYGVKTAQVVEKGGVNEVAPLLAHNIAVFVIDSNNYFRCPQIC
jgi:hypothetical protein